MVKFLFSQSGIIISLILLLGITFLSAPVTVYLTGIGCRDVSRQIPIRVIVELNIGESQDIELRNGERVKLKLVAIEEERDSCRHAIRGAHVKISVDGEEIIIKTGNYNLPVIVGKIQIDCPVIKNYYSDTNKNRWGLSKDACFRLWPKDSPYMAPGKFVYPIKQEWLAALSQSGNEPVYVGGESLQGSVYYHSGFDIGGAEGMDEIISATDGLVIASNNISLEDYIDFPGDVRKDVIYILDNHGWYLRYSHLDSILPDIKPGAMVKMGQKIGYIGKQGHSGGWVHLHFEIKHKELLSGEWSTEDAYVYAWGAYVREYKPSLIAVARPHHISWTGIPVTLDGSKSKSFDGSIISYEWLFTDGSIVQGAIQKKTYDKPGEYSEILKVTDSKGNEDYDFAVVQVYDKENPQQAIPSIQAAYHPTLGIKPGDTVAFLVRTFNSSVGNEVWDFGDGSSVITTKSETVNKKEASKGEFARINHTFSKPGHYIVSVQRPNEQGYTATGRLHVTVNKNRHMEIQKYYADNQFTLYSSIDDMDSFMADKIR